MLKCYNTIVEREWGGYKKWKTEKEFIFGRDNLKERSSDFIKKLEKEEKLLSQVVEKDIKVKPKLDLIREVLNEN